jgi:LAGLIDADG endonuclease
MENIKSYLNSGLIKSYTQKNLCYYVVKKFSDIDENIIPFFTKYLVKGNKVKDFED